MKAEEKAERARQRMIETARQFQIGTYSRKFVANVLQLMIRAEAAKAEGEFPAMVDGVFRGVACRPGECVCVTCGFVGPWKGKSIGGGSIESGHFLASRRASILFEESNVHPQCVHCNRHLNGNHGLYEAWMRHAYGQDEIDRLQYLKAQTVSFTREELVDMRIGYAARLKAAEESMLT
ncbi:MAG: recombination protein NinG [Pyrinomonadaceae bacterium]